MIRRVLLSILPLLLLGCGGSHRSPGETLESAKLKSSSLDLTIVGANTPPAATMRGNGAAQGSLVIDAEPGHPLFVVAVLLTTEGTQGLTQILTFSPSYNGPLAVGTRIEFGRAADSVGGSETTADYDETRYSLADPDGTDATHAGWGASDETTGGTAEVVALGDGRITLRLTGVRLTRSGGQDPITIDGTLSGALKTDD